MGCSSSCQLFEQVSSEIQWKAEIKFGLKLVHYLDSFFLVSLYNEVGKLELNSFLEMSADIGLPMAPEKTFLPATTMSFLGYEIDSM